MTTCFVVGQQAFRDAGHGRDRASTGASATQRGRRRRPASVVDAVLGAQDEPAGGVDVDRLARAGVRSPGSSTRTCRPSVAQAAR